MPLQQFPIGVVMQRRPPAHPWDQARWQVRGIVPGGAHEPTPPSEEDPAEATLSWVVGRLQLALSPDEDDGYFENWIAPEPKVFVRWHAPPGRAAIPIAASVSYSEGARMLDSGDDADGVPMPRVIHEWLGCYLAEHYRPRRRSRGHG